MLREAMWLSEIAERTCQRELSDPDLAAWLSEHESDYGIDGCRDLTCAAQLFDWVVRNIQLEAAPEPQNGVTIAARFSWEALLLGRGEARLRSAFHATLPAGTNPGGDAWH